MVRNKSYFEPPKGRNSTLDGYIDITKRIPDKTPQKKKKKKTSFHVTRNERQAINSLSNDKSIVIKEAGKGAGIVIMNAEFYKRKILDMLNDNSFYKQLDSQCTKEKMKKVKKVI